jgi:hypothetical protein
MTQSLTLAELQRIKLWHVAHKADHPLEYQLWDLVLCIWVMGWMGCCARWRFMRHACTSAGAPVRTGRCACAVTGCLKALRGKVPKSPERKRQTRPSAPVFLNL